MKTLISLLFIMMAVTVVSLVRAEEKKSRQIIGGDLIYSTTALGWTQDEAVFKAESQAVRMIMIECAVPHRDTKIFEFTVNPRGDKFVAQISAGLPLESCEEGRHASADRKTELSNPMLTASQRIYEQYLQGRAQIVQQKAPLTAPASEPVIHASYSQGFLKSYDRYLASQVDRREQTRAALRQSGN
jgi:hypothetical protein